MPMAKQEILTSQWYKEHLRWVWHASKERLPFRKPSSFPFWRLVYVPIVETNFSKLAMSFLFWLFIMEHYVNWSYSKETSNKILHFKLDIWLYDPTWISVILKLWTTCYVDGITFVGDKIEKIKWRNYTKFNLLILKSIAVLLKSWT